MNIAEVINKVMCDRKWKDDEYEEPLNINDMYPETWRFWNTNTEKGENKEMTMKDLDSILEAKGFRVRRYYDSCNRVYKYTIIQNGKEYASDFKYPETTNWDIKNNAMKKFAVDIMKKFYETFCGDLGYSQADPYEIKDVIFNEPATIVFWKDGTKTVVKCQEGDVFDPEKGLTMAITKKLYGNKGSYCNQIKKWCDPYYEKMQEEAKSVADNAFDVIRDTAINILNDYAREHVRAMNYEYVPVTEHYGYIHTYNPDTLKLYEYYACHIDEQCIVRNPDKRNILYHSPEVEDVKTYVAELENRYYTFTEKSGDK